MTGGDATTGEADWIVEAKERAEHEADYFMREMLRVAEELAVDDQWFVERCIGHLTRLFKKWKDKGVYPVEGVE